jgi:hypothetical protein
MPSVLSRAAVAVMMCWLSACTASPMSVVGNFDSDTRLLEFGAQSRFNASDAASQLRQQVPLIYFFAFQAGVLQMDPDTRTYPAFTNDLDQQQAALVGVERNRWIEVAQAGEKNIDLICAQYQSALYALDKNRRATLANLNALQSATVGIMGLALAAQKAIGIVGVAFGLAASLFDTTLNSVLYQLPPASVVSVMNAQRDIFRGQETGANPEWVTIQNPIAVGNRLNEYIRYCTPVIIEANVGKLLAQTTADANGQLSARTQPATGPTLPSIVRHSFSSTDLRNRVAALTPAQALTVERTMSGRLAERPADLQQNLRAMVGPSGIRTGAQAKAFLQAWIVLEDPNPTFEQEWADALDAAGTQASGTAGSAVPTRAAPAPTPAPPQQAPSALEQQVLALSPQDALPAAQAMYPRLADRSDDLQRRMRALVGSEAGLTADNAKPFLIAWLRSDGTSPRFQAQWVSALGVQTHQASYSSALQQEIFALKPGPALAIAQAMYPGLADRPPALRETLQADIPSFAALNERNAKPVLSKWIVLENRTPAFEAEWTRALASVPH